MRLMQRLIVFSVMSASCLSAVAAEPTAQPATNPIISAEIERLARPEKATAAITALAKLGKPAVPMLIDTLKNPSNEVRTGAADALRQILATDPAAAPNRHDKVFWEAKIAQTTVGMSLVDALVIFLPNLSREEQKAAAQGGMWSGGSGATSYRLDDYWTVELGLYNLGHETLAAPPELTASVLSTWVKPPDDYTGTWVNWFVNGQKANEIEYAHGKYNGTFTAFYDNGTKCYVQHYKEHIGDGTDIGWYKSGKRMYEGQYKDNKQDGRWQRWFENGQVQSIDDYKDGERNGLHATWLEKGQKEYEQHFVNDQQEGLDRAWDEHGALLWHRMFHEGQIVERQ